MASASLSTIRVSESLVLRPTTGDDLATLRGFFADPTFNEQWGGRPLDDDEILAKYTGQRSPQVECFLVEQDRSPIGLIQYWAAKNDGEGGGVDFVLINRARGVGIGRAVVRALIHHLQRECGWQRITVDPDTANTRGINFWAATGFISERLIEDDPEREPYQLMSWPIDLESRGTTPTS